MINLSTMACGAKCSFINRHGFSITTSHDYPPCRSQFSHHKMLLLPTITHQMLLFGCNPSWNGHFAASNFPNKKKRREIMRELKAELPGSSGRIANLFAERKERMKLPNYTDNSDRSYPISKFLCHTSGVESMLNTRALQSFHSLDHNTYRCHLQKIQLLNFEVAPVLDLRVSTTDEDCTVELLSCKFEGSKSLEHQNNHFSAFMRNHITWDANCAEPTLDVDVKLNIMLEVYTPPFTLLPISAVEAPGNIVMQALIDRLVPLLLQQLLQDYHNWVLAQSQISQQTVHLSSIKANQEDH